MRFTTVFLILTLLPVMVFSQAGADCPTVFDGSAFAAPRLAMGAIAQVMPGTPNRVRSGPSTSEQILFEMPQGTQFNVLSGPTCSEGIVWWQVEFDGQTGWTAESASGAYFIEPVMMPSGPLGGGVVPPVPDDALSLPDVMLDQGAVYIKFSADDVLIVAPDAEANLVDLWDIDTGTRFDMNFPHDPQPVTDQSEIIYYSENDQEDVIVTGDVANRIVVWNAMLEEQGRIEADLLDGYEPVYVTDPMFTTVGISGCLEEDSDGCLAGVAQFFDIETQEPLFELGGQEGEITAMAFSPDGGFVATAATDGTIFVFDLEGEGLLTQIVASNLPVYDIDFSSRDDMLAAGYCISEAEGICATSAVGLFDWASGDLISDYPSHNGEITSIDVNADGQLVASAGTDEVVRIRAIFEDGRIVKTLMFAANDVRFFDNFAEIATAGDFSIGVWSLD